MIDDVKTEILTVLQSLCLTLSGDLHVHFLSRFQRKIYRFGALTVDLLDCVANEEGLIDRDTMGAATPDRGSKLEHIMAQLLTGKVVSV